MINIKGGKSEIKVNNKAQVWSLYALGRSSEGDQSLKLQNEDKKIN